MIRGILCTDLDGSLLNGGSANPIVRPEVVQRLEQMRTDNILIAYLTGRGATSYFGIGEEKLSRCIVSTKIIDTLLPRPNYLALENGAELYVPQDDDLVLHEEWKQRILGPHNEHAYALDQWVQSNLTEKGFPVRQKNVGYFVEKVSLTAAQRTHLDKLVNDQHVVVEAAFNLEFYEFVPPTAGKEKVVDFIAEQYPGVPIVAIGDGMNDVGMLINPHASLAITPRGAYPEVINWIQLRKDEGLAAYVSHANSRGWAADMLEHAHKFFLDPATQR